LYPKESVENVGLPGHAMTPLGPLEFHGRANFMKLGIVLADAVTTVSPTYAREIQESPELGMGLEGVLRSRSDSLKGILNGIDYAVWDPRTDPLLPAHYSTEDLAGKATNRAHLLKAFGWDQQDEGPVVAMIGRLAVQKGWDLVLDAARRMVKLGLRLVVLGTGERAYEKRLAALTRRHPTRVGTALRFDEALAHLMEAGSDIFLMPSRYEPCGLNQMISLRYGSIPVVKATGGLRDTVTEFDPATRTGNGFLFSQHAPEAMLQALARAAKLYRDRPTWKKLVRNAMRTNCSWKASAEKYLELYGELIARG
jgi:starch synthase